MRKWQTHFFRSSLIKREILRMEAVHLEFGIFSFGLYLLEKPIWPLFCGKVCPIDLQRLLLCKQCAESYSGCQKRNKRWNHTCLQYNSWPIRCNLLVAICHRNCVSGNLAVTNCNWMADLFSIFVWNGTDLAIKNLGRVSYEFFCKDCLTLLHVFVKCKIKEKSKKNKNSRKRLNVVWKSVLWLEKHKKKASWNTLLLSISKRFETSWKVAWNYSIFLRSMRFGKRPYLLIFKFNF